MPREGISFMFAALVTVAFLLVVGVASYILYLTPNPKDEI